MKFSSWRKSNKIGDKQSFYNKLFFMIVGGRSIDAARGEITEEWNAAIESFYSYCKAENLEPEMDEAI